MCQQDLARLEHATLTAYPARIASFPQCAPKLIHEYLCAPPSHLHNADMPAGQLAANEVAHTGDTAASNIRQFQHYPSPRDSPTSKILEARRPLGQEDEKPELLWSGHLRKAPVHLVSYSVSLQSLVATRTLVTQTFLVRRS